MYEELIQILNSLCIDAVELKNDVLLDKCLDACWKAKCLQEHTIIYTYGQPVQPPLFANSYSGTPEIQGTGVVVNNQEWDIPIGT